MKKAEALRRMLTKWIATPYWRLYYKTALLLYKHKIVIGCIVLISLLALSIIYEPKLNAVLRTYFLAPNRLKALQTFLVTLGGVMIGAVAIVFTIVMFAMQVNVGRMPYGLFRRFSSDYKLLGLFATILFLAIMITCLSVITNESLATINILVAGWSMAIILILFLITYQRALDLINPIKQLIILVADAKKGLNGWAKAAQRSAPLFRPQITKETASSTPETNYDTERFIYFKAFPYWTSEARKAITYAFSLAKYHAAQGDYESSLAALNAVVHVNSAYIDAKGKTFMADISLIDRPISHDSFITETLEHLRKYSQTGLLRRDEQQITQSFTTACNLCKLYLTIDYSTVNTSKTHANISAAYLTNSIEAVIPLKMTDVLMEGLRLTGDVSHHMINSNNAAYIATIADKIFRISVIGIADQECFPVTQKAVEQLAKLTSYLLMCKTDNIDFILKTIRNNVSSIAKLVLEKPETLSSEIHRINLSEYYSLTSGSSLATKLSHLASNALGAKADNKDMQRITEHIAQFGDELFRTEKELLLLAVEKKSSFTFDIIYWITHVTKILLAVSKADCCSSHSREKLIGHASWLICTLSWVPDNEETICFVENHQLTNLLFEVATKANQLGCHRVATKINELLLSWGFKAGKYRTSLFILERACKNLAHLIILFKLKKHTLINSITQRIKEGNAPAIELRQIASNNIMEEAISCTSDYSGFSRPDSSARSIDKEELQTILTEIANRLVDK